MVKQDGKDQKKMEEENIVMEIFRENEAREKGWLTGGEMKGGNCKNNHIWENIRHVVSFSLLILSVCMSACLCLHE